MVVSEDSEVAAVAVSRRDADQGLHFGSGFRHNLPTLELGAGLAQLRANFGQVNVRGVGHECSLAQWLNRFQGADGLLF